MKYISDLYVGCRVQITSYHNSGSNVFLNKCGRVVELDITGGHKVRVEMDEPCMLCTGLHGLCKDGYGYTFDIDEVDIEVEDKTVAKEIKLVSPEDIQIQANNCNMYDTIDISGIKFRMFDEDSEGRYFVAMTPPVDADVIFTRRHGVDYNNRIGFWKTFLNAYSNIFVDMRHSQGNVFNRGIFSEYVYETSFGEDTTFSPYVMPLSLDIISNHSSIKYCVHRSVLLDTFHCHNLFYIDDEIISENFLKTIPEFQDFWDNYVHSKSGIAMVVKIKKI